MNENELSLQEVQNTYLKEIENNIEYSLEVDPQNKYQMTPQLKEFTKYYSEYKNVHTAADLAGIDMDTAKEYFVNYGFQQEIRRINKAFYQRQFANKLLSLDQIGGLLSSWLIGDNVPIGDQLELKDKLKVVQMMIDLNKLKSNAFDNPQILMTKNVEVQIHDLSVDAIKTLLAEEKKKSEKNYVDFSEINENLTPEEEAYLQTLPTEELLKLINETKGDQNTDDKTK